MATLPGAWCYRVSTGTGGPSVSILWPGEVESLICNLYLSVAARKIVWAGPSLRYTRCVAGMLSNQQTNKHFSWGDHLGVGEGEITFVFSALVGCCLAIFCCIYHDFFSFCQMNFFSQPCKCCRNSLWWTPCWTSGTVSTWRVSDLGSIPIVTVNLFPGHVKLVISSSFSLRSSDGNSSLLHEGGSAL